MANDGKFTTISSTLFTKQNSEQLPDWMENLNTDIKKIDKIDLDFNSRGAFASKLASNERDSRIGKPRAIEATSDKLILDAKIQLAKILTNKYYRVTDVKGNTRTAHLSTDIDGIPAKFVFSFEFDNGKTSPSKTFEVVGSSEVFEYPFSKAGLTECINDIKSNKLPANKKIEAVGKTYVISKEEVVRRFNGKLRDAHNKINELLKSGDIIGAGSNTFASFIDVDQLFPKMQKEAMQEEVKSFEFVPNMEHVAATQKLSAQLLRNEANQFLANIFPDYLIKSSALDKNELLVKATILSKNNTQHEVDFNFNIEENKLGSLRLAEYNDERMTVEQLMDKLNINSDLLNSYLATTNNKNNRLYRGIILSRKEIKRKLAKLVHAETIEQIIENWSERNLINPINSSTFVSDLSMEDLLDSVDVDILNEDEQKDMLDDGARTEKDLSRIDVEDTGNREMNNAITEENMLAKANGLLSRYFANFEPVQCALSNESLNYCVRLFDQETGLSTTVNLSFIYDQNNQIVASVVNGKNNIPIDRAREIFAQNAALKKYLSVNGNNKKTNSSIIISKLKLHNILSKISNVTEKDVDLQINNWIKSGNLQSLSDNIFASKHTLEKLLSLSNIIPMTEQETNNMLRKSQREKELKPTANYLNDSDTRQVEDVWSAERCLTHVKECISKYANTNQFEIMGMTNKPDSLNVVACVVGKHGLNDTYELKIQKLNNKLGHVEDMTINGGSSTTRESNDTFEKYHNVQSNAAKQYIFTKYSLKDKLSVLGSKLSVENSVQYLLDNNIINEAAINGSYISKHNIGQIVAMLDDKEIIDKNFEAKWDASKKEAVVITDARKVYDTDNRKILKKAEKLSPKMINLQEKLSKIVNASYKNKLITANKQIELNNNLSVAKSEKDLDLVAKELNKYIGK